ncbi:MAG: aspartate aminotransferase family protein [Alphaproteobacteria bacterium]|nr:MAG: aspartate aminotransferase family protein [Alphaproteobacteria bacterium]
MTHYPLTTPSGAASKQLIERGKQFWTQNYAPRSMILDHGKGSVVWDKDGNDYIDLGSGIAVCSLGHQEPDLVAALEQQARKLWHTSNIFYTEPPIELAEKLVNLTPFAKRVYFCNSGAEANEAAIKIIRKWAASQGRSPQEREIISFTGSFHGRTVASVTATAQPKYHEGFEPLPAGFIYCDPFNDLEALEKLITPKTAAIILEPIQGEGGIIPAKRDFLRGVRALCDKHNILLVVDEIQCGMGRTGILFAHTYAEDLRPDMMTLAKALGCGVPIGATLVGEKLEHILQVGTHGSTYGGNPMMCAVASVALDKLASPMLMMNVQQRSQEIFQRFAKMNERLGMFREVRGRGLMIGAELIPALHNKAAAISEHARTYGVLVLVAGPNVLRLLPPLNITKTELDTGMARLEEALASYAF